ncbi:uncharacterized protein LOC143031994 isoform X2 [Oratosquilla oratoria]|uniref:uncharacterized protein LOC143031994 isoform X2 n=1 Tax=Oratosquilla oratoria TaxID=337810 RepID=UPI003F760448
MATARVLAMDGSTRETFGTASTQIFNAGLLQVSLRTSKNAGTRAKDFQGSKATSTAPKVLWLLRELWTFADEARPRRTWTSTSAPEETTETTS